MPNVQKPKRDSCPTAAGGLRRISQARLTVDLGALSCDLSSRTYVRWPRRLRPAPGQSGVREGKFSAQQMKDVRSQTELPEQKHRKRGHEKRFEDPRCNHPALQEGDSGNERKGCGDRLREPARAGCRR